MKKNYLISMCAILLLILSCKSKKEYSIATLSKGTTYYSNGVALSRILKRKNIKLKVIADEKLGSFVNCQMVWNHEVDFGIAQNDTNIVDFLGKNANSMVKSKIRTVLPLYPEILYVIYSKNRQPRSFRDLVKGRRIGVGPKNSGTSKFFRVLLKNFGIQSGAYTIVNTPWLRNNVSHEIDISVTLAGYNTSTVIKMLRSGKCKLFSFSNIELYGKGSAVEGFCINYPSARPYIIPVNTYGTKPEAPVVTLAVDAVLISHYSIDKYVIYNMVSEIITQKNILSNMDPLLNAISEKFDVNSLGFPLHEGTKMYLERNKPSFFERYAEVFGVILSIFIATAGILTSIVKWRQSVKKNRVDVYYEKALAIEKESAQFQKDSEYQEAITQLLEIKHEAFARLINEKLVANESFNIFLTLTDNLVERLEHKLQANKQHA